MPYCNICSICGVLLLYLTAVSYCFEKWRTRIWVSPRGIARIMAELGYWQNSDIGRTCVMTKLGQQGFESAFGNLNAKIHLKFVLEWWLVISS